MNDFNKLRTISDVAVVSVVAIELENRKQVGILYSYQWLPKSNLNSWNELQR